MSFAVETCSRVSRKGPTQNILFIVLVAMMTSTMLMFLPEGVRAAGRRPTTVQSLAFLTSTRTARLREISTMRLLPGTHSHSKSPIVGYFRTSRLIRRAELSSFASSLSTSSASTKEDECEQPSNAPPMQTSPSPTNTLGWETFEFSIAPKWDARFDEESSTEDDKDVVTTTIQNNNDHDLSEDQIQYPVLKKRNAVSNTTMLHQQVSPEEWSQIVQEERVKDEELSRKLHLQHAALQSIDPTLVERAIEILSKVVQPDRFQRISHLLQQRTRHVRFLFENPGNPSNVWACLRTLDSFGIQHVGIIMDPNYYEQGGGKAAIVQKRGMRTAMGSAQWMTIHHYLTTTQALEHVRDELGFCIVASDVHEGAHDIRALPWNQLSVLKKGTKATTSDDSTAAPPTSTTPPICIVMGNEGKGISEEMRQACDATFYLPMSGFAESFNLSVATAITCAHLSAASSATAVTNNHGGPLLRPGDLDAHEYNCLLLKGLLHSFAKKRTGHALLLNQGIVLPPEMNWI